MMLGLYCNGAQLPEVEFAYSHTSPISLEIALIAELLKHPPLTDVY
jgi:hypothetical protein